MKLYVRNYIRLSEQRLWRTPLEKQDFTVFDNIPETNTYHTKTKDRTISYFVKSLFEKT